VKKWFLNFFAGGDMQEFTFYASADDKTLYRYLIRQRGRVYYVSMSLTKDGVEQALPGTKVLMNISHDDVIAECLSHCRRRSLHAQRHALFSGVRNWLVCSVAVLVFLRLIIARA
jgi:hypothetical protein